MPDDAIHVPGYGGGLGDDVESIRLRLAALGRDLACPLCGSHAFTKSPGLDEGIMLLYERPGSTLRTEGGYLPVFAISCTDCGHVLLFERRAVLGDLPTPLL